MFRHELLTHFSYLNMGEILIHQSIREDREFKEILKTEFNLSEQQAKYLHATVENANCNFENHLQTITNT